MAKTTSQKAPDLTQLYALRAEQDQVDREIMTAIGKRVAIRRLISAFRSKHGLQTVDAERAKVVLNNARDLAAECDVPAEMAQDIFETLIDWSHRLDKQWREEN